MSGTKPVSMESSLTSIGIDKTSLGTESVLVTGVGTGEVLTLGVGGGGVKPGGGTDKSGNPGTRVVRVREAKSGTKENVEFCEDDTADTVGELGGEPPASLEIK
uniref:Uncharacterized protein n=1 Tax=Cacopsylla melanoneura TaxID=428564 RepID=A0A8D9BZQ7_9HEMI